MKVGFIGIGMMGWPMAVNLAKAGVLTSVFDTNPDQSAKFAKEHGVPAAKKLADLADNDFIVTMLPTSAIVRQVFLDADGGALAKALKPGTIVVDMSSSEPVAIRNLGAELAKTGVILIDAPVSGGVPRATDGSLTIMIGGNDKAAIEKAKPLLSHMGKRLFEVGPLGAGDAMKALNNYAAAAAFAASAEALMVGKKFGLDPGMMVDIMNISTGKNFHTEMTLKAHVVEKKFATGFQIGLLAKDVKIAADLAKAMGVDAPVSRLVEERWASARDELGPTTDNSKAIMSWDKSF